MEQRRISSEVDDPYLWLEEVKGDVALEWVAVQNKKTFTDLNQYSAFDNIYQKSLKIYRSELDRSQFSLHNQYLYTVKQNDEHERGVWQRTSMESYLNSKPVWEKLLDIDSLSEAESENLYFKGAAFATPTSNRCIISFTLGGGEHVGREFDVKQKAFVNNGFYIQAGTGVYSWRDENSMYMTMPFDKEHMEKGRYKHIVKAWKRGKKLEDAEIVFQDLTDAYGAFTVVDHRVARRKRYLIGN